MTPADDLRNEQLRKAIFDRLYEHELGSVGFLDRVWAEKVTDDIMKAVNAYAERAADGEVAEIEKRHARDIAIDTRKEGAWQKLFGEADRDRATLLRHLRAPTAVVTREQLILCIEAEYTKWFKGSAKYRERALAEYIADAIMALYEAAKVRG